MRARPGGRAASDPDDPEEGLFGQLLLWAFELLPWLDSRGLRPDRHITAKLDGAARRCAARSTSPTRRPRA